MLAAGSPEDRLPAPTEHRETILQFYPANFLAPGGQKLAYSAIDRLRDQFEQEVDNHKGDDKHDDGRQCGQQQ